MTLAAVREALLADAREEGERILGEARDEAEDRIAEARSQADQLVARARARGRAEGRVQAAHDAAMERASARFSVLSAQRRSYEELRTRARAAVLELRDQEGYAELVERLTASVRRDLGEGAEIERDPPGGGVRASAGSRSVDCTLPTLARRCVDDLGVRLERLWA